MKAIRAVVFDLDDTLYPERAYAFSGFTAVAHAFADILGDPQQATAEMQRLFESEHRGRVFDALLAKKACTVDRKMVRRMIETFRAHRPTLRLFSDAQAALDRLRADYRLGLISDGVSGPQWRKIDALGLRSRLDCLVVTSDLGPGGGKPNPRGFELVREKLDVEHAECAYIGDNAMKDFVAPNRLEWLTVQVVREDGIYRDARPAPGGAPQHTIVNLDHLDAILAATT